MFDNVAFNVVIGLVLIYLLYSLLVTILSETISRWLGIRGRLLRLSIERMLNDGASRKTTFGSDLEKAKGFYESFAGQFYDYPSIKYLAKSNKGLFRDKYPSYISAETFADTLINMFCDKGAGPDKISQVNFCLQNNIFQIEPETIKTITNLLSNAGPDINKFRNNLIQWFHETQDRNTGWYKRKLKVISFSVGFLIAVFFNVDSIRIAQLLAKDKDARDKLVSMGIALAKDSTRYKDIIKANGDTILAKSVIDTGYSRVKKDIDSANVILGLGWHLNSLKKADSYTIDYNKEDKKDSLQFLNAKNKIKSIKPFDSKVNEALKRINDNVDTIHYLNDSIQLISADTFALVGHIRATEGADKKKFEDLYLGTLDHIGNLQKRIQALIFSNKSDSVIVRINKANGEKFRTAINSEIDNYFFRINSADTTKDGNHIEIIGFRDYDWGERWNYFWHVFFIDYGWLGFLLTGLALSLGAPFWFGVLNKLVSLRAAGVKPEEKKKDAPTDTDPKTTAGIFSLALPKEDPVDAALRIYGDLIRKEKGVLKVAQGFIPNKKPLEKCVQVNVIDKETGTVIQSKFGRLKLGDASFVDINLLVTGKPRPSASNGSEFNVKARALGNKAKINGWGSYGCIVKDKFSNQQYILSCFHTMKGDRDWQKVGKQQIIINEDSEVAKEFKGCINNQLDAAVALVSNDIAKNYFDTLDKSPKTLYAVTEKDVFVTNVKMTGGMTEDSSGTIIHNSWSDTFSYDLDNGKEYKNEFSDILVISRFDNGVQKAINTNGDSGALLTDDKGNAYGIVFASDNMHTYAIKMSNILDQLALTLDLTKKP